MEVSKRRKLAKPEVRWEGVFAAAYHVATASGVGWSNTH